MNFKDKVQREMGNHFGGYLTPAELIEIAKEGAVCNKQDVVHAWYAVKHEDATPQWYFFKVDEKSQLFQTLTQ